MKCYLLTDVVQDNDVILVSIDLFIRGIYDILESKPIVLYFRITRKFH